MKKTILDNTFLNSHLTLTTDDEEKTVTGELMVLLVDEPLRFSAKTVCLEGDTYNEKFGIDSVKVKLVNQYYSYKKNQARLEIEQLSKRLKAMKEIYVHSDKKLQNNRSSFAKYDLNFYQ